MNIDIKHKLMEKYARKAGLRARINAKCIECVYDPHMPGGWRQQVEKCTSLSCPLYSVRPIGTGTKGEPMGELAAVTG